jgi:hypothetical protein
VGERPSSRPWGDGRKPHVLLVELVPPGLRLNFCSCLHSARRIRQPTFASAGFPAARGRSSSAVYARPNMKALKMTPRVSDGGAGGSSMIRLIDRAQRPHCALQPRHRKRSPVVRGGALVAIAVRTS